MTSGARHHVFHSLDNLAEKVKGTYQRHAGVLGAGLQVLGAGLQVKALRYELPWLLRQLHDFKANLQELYDIIEAAHRTDAGRCGLVGLVRSMLYAEGQILDLFGGSLAQAFTLTGPMWYVSALGALEGHLALRLGAFNSGRGAAKKCKTAQLATLTELHEQAIGVIEVAIERLKVIPRKLAKQVVLPEADDDGAATDQ